jgi:glyoxylase-like metal-dependent hydrolase (beta-lactamase superfamily II)
LLWPWWHSVCYKFEVAIPLNEPLFKGDNKNIFTLFTNLLLYNRSQIGFYSETLREKIMTDFTRRAALGASAALLASTQFSLAQGAAPMLTNQAPGFYRYKVGDLVVTGIHDGFGKRPVEGFIKNAELAEVQAVLKNAFMPTDSLSISYTTLVLQTSEGLVIIDTGNGDSGAPTSGTWMANFKAAGFDAKDVKKVIISHFHGDHINGLRLKDGTAVFPNAEVSVPKAEWDFWMSDERMSAAPEAMKGAFNNVRRVFNPIPKDLKFYANNQDVAKGITAIAAHGHSPGHSVFAISSGNARMMMMSDTTNHPALFVSKPDWSAIFDMNADEARATRHRLLDMAASERMQLAFYHAPFPATGYVGKEGKTFTWVPINWGV